MSEAEPNPLNAFCDNLRLDTRNRLSDGHAQYTAEIARALEIMAWRDDPHMSNRRIRCNPVFLDADGIERSAAVEGALAALAQGKAPVSLRGRVVLSLNYEALMAGVDVRALVQRRKEIHAKYPHFYRFEDLDRFPEIGRTFDRHMREWKVWEHDNAAYQRLRAVFAALAARREPAILFIDHLHRILGGDWQRFPFDMAPVLKPLLSRREIQLWGACTLAEYRTSIEPDATMQVRFQEICLPSTRALLK